VSSRPSSRSFWVIRGLLVGLTFVLGVVLLRRGNVVIGVLIGAIAVTRGVMFMQVWRRREQIRRRAEARFRERRQRV